MTKRLTILFGGWLVWALLMTVPVFADGGPHSGYKGTGTPGGSCAGCHRAHTAQAPDLLKETQPQLCYSCHGDTAQGAGTDVEGGVYYSSHDPRTGSASVLPLRGGGFAYALIDTVASHASGWSSNDLNPGTAGNIPVLTTRTATTSAHTVNGTSATMWGNGPISATSPNAGPTVSLYCSSCHDPHGNGKYRILRPIPMISGSPVASTGVSIADATTKVYTTANYWNVDYTTDAAAVDANISAWCSTCHTRYLADNFASQTSSTDAIFAFRHQTNSTAAYTPICIQCHVAHGSNATESRSAAEVGLPGQPIDSTVVNASDSRLLRLNDRSICQMCHLR